MKLQINMGGKALLVVFLLLAGCKHPEYQELQIDKGERTLQVMSTLYVIDSVFVDGSGKLYYSKALRDKTCGSSKISMGLPDEGYETFVDSTGNLSCNENLNWGIVIRKKGSTTRVTRRLATGTEHSDDIQIIFGLNFNVCATGIERLSTDKVWK
ncbi:MAG TPA: hypothetical protein VGD65_13415 [Chryseosolibacter sp.]